MKSHKTIFILYRDWYPMRYCLFFCDSFAILLRLLVFPNVANQFTNFSKFSIMIKSLDVSKLLLKSISLNFENTLHLFHQLLSPDSMVLVRSTGFTVPAVRTLQYGPAVQTPRCKLSQCSISFVLPINCVHHFVCKTAECETFLHHSLFNELLFRFFR